ncbi:Helix-turn-helix domain-containing protein [Streptomyces zhaozhouensis]|jgi:transcriptional regulator with XRE-family HTH domain|uniref:Helix-turn-helix domain-containing protein n=1 Tax=Streptomyces zhaozhouensis TaxID=1300267 RepID=A0A286DZ07_9ACTN|nr:helix-turn-helix transcriptional regulator [Streptomyces zhaozhouensis]SOD63909.1 Helix-turn-helix domain-containing protein [Streptomyces zhaozhouensis]
MELELDSAGTLSELSPPPMALDFRQTGPTVPRLILGNRLRALREAQGITGADAGREIRGSHSKISRLEMGRIGFKPRDVDDLLTLYGVYDTAERATLQALVRESNSQGWWHYFHDVVPSWLHMYLGLEQAATVIRGYELQFVPGLLQTEEYARAVIGLDPDTPERRERKVQLRMARQQVLHRDRPPTLWVIVDEAALRRSMGGRALMRGQLTHLIEATRMPHVTVQVVPFAAGAHSAIAGPVTVLRPPGGELPDVVYLEQLTGGAYPDKPSETEQYRHVMNRLAVEALPPEETERFLWEALREL